MFANAAQLRSENDALFARIMGQFDDLDAMAERIKAQMKADGLIREPDARQRATDEVSA